MISSDGWQVVLEYVRKSVFVKDMYERAVLDFATHPSKEFFRQTNEKKGRERLISSLLDANKEEVSTQTGMQEIAKSFYADLWKKRETERRCQDDLLASLTRSISDDDRLRLDRPVTKEEVLAAFGQMAKGKTPGMDGLPAEFYQSFQSILADRFVSMCNIVLASECSASQKTAVISLLFKKENRADIKNYRPISLLNSDYKIIAKILANRLKSVLRAIVHTDQTGFVPGGDIGENVLLTQSIINFCEEQQKDGYLIFLDWEKAFDRVDHEFMFKVLEKYGFGARFVQSVRALYTNIESRLCLNQYISSSFSVMGGVRQGCPLSPYLFILVLECLAARLRGRREIVGITEPLSKVETVVSMFADDGTVFLSGLAGMKPVREEICLFGKGTGAALNQGKTLVMRVGPCRHRPPTQTELTMCSYRFISNHDLPIKVLGMPVGPDITEEQIFREPLSKLTKMVAFLSRFHLSLVAKAVLFNIRIMSVFLYRARLCHCPNIYKQLKDAATQLLWGAHHKRARVAWRKVICPLEEGGLNIIDPASKFMAVKATWLVRGLRNEPSAWKQWFLRDLFLLCLEHNTNNPLAPTKKLARADCFIKDILHSWAVFVGHIPRKDRMIRHERYIEDAWATHIRRLSSTDKSLFSMQQAFKAFNVILVHHILTHNTIAPHMAIFSSSAVYKKAITAISLPALATQKHISAASSNSILTCADVHVQVRQFWFFLRHGAHYPLARLKHFDPSVTTDTCPLCHLQREKGSHAFSTCPALRPLWRALQQFLRSHGHPGIAVDSNMWNLLFLQSLVTAQFPSPICIKATALLHYYHWQERKSCIKSHKPYKIAAVLLKWKSHFHNGSV